jgi:hypothetical protein
MIGERPRRRHVHATFLTARLRCKDVYSTHVRHGHDIVHKPRHASAASIVCVPCTSSVKAIARAGALTLALRS